MARSSLFFNIEKESSIFISTFRAGKRRFLLSPPLRQPDARKLNVPVKIDTIIFRREHDCPVVHKRHIEALSVLDLRLQRVDQLTVLREDGEIEVVVVGDH